MLSSLATTCSEAARTSDISAISIANVAFGDEQPRRRQREPPALGQRVAGAREWPAPAAYGPFLLVGPPRRGDLNLNAIPVSIIERIEVLKDGARSTDPMRSAA